MPARVLRPTHLVEAPRRVLVPLGGDFVETTPVEISGDPRYSAERERVLALALREFQQRWEAREREYVAALQLADVRAAEIGQEAVAASVRRLATLAEELHGQRDEIFQAAEEAVVRLALAIARRIVGDAVAVDAELVLQTVRRALHHVTEAQWIVIHVHPEDLQLVEQHAAEWSDAARRSRSLRIEADARIRRGGCILEADTGQVAATIDDQLATLEAALIERLR